MSDTKTLREALEAIATWPDGGSRYGQQNIKRFARNALAAQAQSEPANGFGPKLYPQVSGFTQPAAQPVCQPLDGELVEMAEVLQAICARVIEQYSAVYAGIDFAAVGGRVNRVLARVREESEAAQPVAVPASQLAALDAAVSALYFDDSSKFRASLGSVILHLDQQLAGEVLCHPKAAYDRVKAMLAAAPKVSAPKPTEIDPRFAAAHYEHDLFVGGAS